MKLVKCNIAEGAEMSLEYRPGEWSRQLGRGAVVDVDEKVGKREIEDEDGKPVVRDVLVRDLIRGREDLFVAVEPQEKPTEQTAPAPKK
jgi:hypothetical protein